MRWAKGRAIKFGLPFSLSVEDIQVPEFCPVLGIRLVRGKGKPHDNSPSLDRIVPNKGYVRGNVIVISRRANQIKSNAHPGELALVASFFLTLKGTKP